ncbi:MAG: CobD/CbiB family protein [Pseudomonadota bacterium]
MAFFTVLAALAIEHARPLRQPLFYYRHYTRFTHWIERRFNGGEAIHGVIGWGLAILPVIFGAWLAFVLLGRLHPLLGWAWNVAVLYFTLGFKYYSDDAESIARLLRAGDVEAAREKFGAWRHCDASQLSADDLARVTIEQTLAASHRQMFGVLFWFVLLAPFGPVGAVLFRATSILGRHWEGTRGEFGVFARRVFHAINWLPARLTALTYAIAGNFEDAVYAWRTQAGAWPDLEEGVVLAAGAGAMGVKLGQPITLGGESAWRPELGSGQAPDHDCIESAVSMIWRGLIIWLAAGLLIVIAGWVS